MSEHEESLGETWSRMHWLVRALCWGLVALVVVDVGVQLLVWAMVS